MAAFSIADENLKSLKNAVVVLTGGSSGIGLATTELLLAHGAKVIVGDRQKPPQIASSNLTFEHTDVTSWSDLSALFRLAQTKYGRVDHVFANAGISGRANYTEDDVDDHGELKEPDHSVININLIAVTNTVKLALHHIRKHDDGGSIVLTASTAAYQRFSVVDYTTAKHGVLGLMRGLAGHIASEDNAIRINAIAPSWTATGIVPKGALEAIGVPVQEPLVVARSVAILMADRSRNQQLIFSAEGQFAEIEKQLLESTREVFRGLGRGERNEEDDLKALIKAGALARG